MVRLRKAEELRKASERKLADIVDFLPDATFALDLQGSIILWNKAMERMTGRKAKNVLGKGNHEYAIPFYGKRRPGIAELLLKPDKRVERLYSEFRRTEKSIAIEVHIPNMRGKDVFLWAITKPLYDAGGRIVGVIEAIRDITEHRKAEDKLKESEANFRALFDTTGDPMFVHDFKGKILNANSAACEKLGYSRKEMLALTLRKIDVPENAKLMLGRMRQLIRKGRIVFEGAHITKAGKRFPVEVSARAGEYYGAPAVLSIARDITERKIAEDKLKESEEKFRSLVEASHDLIMLTDIRGRLIYMSPACRKVIGWDPKDLTGHRPDIFHPEDRARVEAARGQALRGKSGLDLHYRIITQKGQVRWVSHSWSPLRVNGKLKLIASVVQDITGRKKAMERLIRQKEQIEELSKMKERFTADMTHELKTPLSVIMLNLEMARKLDPAAQRNELKECLELMWRNSMRLSRSVDQIMQLTRMQSVDISTAHFHLTRLMSGVCEEYLPLAKTKGIGFEMGGPDIKMKGNQHLLAMAVSNLVSNAIKFTYRGTVRVSWIESGRDVIITVSDSGIGIKPENRRKVFEKFFKEDHDAPGSGIGLPISAEIIAKMGGRMEFDSTHGSGSAFRIIIPKEVSR